MEIKTTKDILKTEYRGSFNINLIEDNSINKKWVALDDDVKEALSLYLHLRKHTEVNEAPTYKGMPICKICNKSAYQIMCEEWESLSTSKKEGN